MKKQGFYLLLLLSVFISVTSCSDKDETKPNNQTEQAPTFEPKTVTPPTAMQESSDPGAQMATSFINMANSFAGMAGMMVPPYKSTLDDPWVHTWEFNEGQDIYTVTLTVSETTTHYTWNMVIDGILDGYTLTDFLYMEASETKDGKTGEFIMYDYEETGYMMKVSWMTDESGVYTLSFEMPEDELIELTTNLDGSGSISTYEWEQGGWMLSFEAIWDVTGHGEWWEYYEGELVDQGSW